MRALVVAWTFVRVAAMNEFRYRAAFVVQLFQSAAWLGAALAVLLLVFSHTRELNGWDEYELLALFGVHMFLGGVIGAAIQPAMQRLMDDVHDGSLDFVLTKPDDSQLLASVREFRLWRLVDVFAGLGIVGFALSGVEREVGAGDAAALALTLVVGMAILYCFWLAVATTAFWVVRLGAFNDLFDSLYQAGRWPVSIYPSWLRYGFTFVVPLGFAVTVPGQAATSRLDWTQALAAAGFAALVALLSRRFFRRGLNRYSGASA